jgi:hypothetical protein
MFTSLWQKPEPENTLLVLYLSPQTRTLTDRMFWAGLTPLSLQSNYIGHSCDANGGDRLDEGRTAILYHHLPPLGSYRGSHDYKQGWGEAYWWFGRRPGDFVTIYDGE